MTSNYSTGNEAHRLNKRAAQEISTSKWGERIYAGAVNPDRRHECTNSFKSFCENYMPEAFHLGWSSVHLEAIEKIEDAVNHAGNYALAMPRGSGKSTLSKAGVLWSVLTGRVRYGMFIGATANASNSALSAMKSNLQYNDDLLEDFPEICAVIRFIEGETRKAAGMRWNGEVTNLSWGMDRVILPTLQNFDEEWYKAYPNNFSGILDVSSITGNIRGRAIELPSGDIIRPELAICDDIQDRESAASPTQVQKRLMTLKGDVAYLGSPTRPCSIIAPITVIYEEDVACQLLDHKLNPEFRGTRSAMLPKMPWDGMDEAARDACEELWVEYGVKRDYDFLNQTKHHVDFYLENREELDGNGEASWPERYSEQRSEVSAIQSAMNLYLSDEQSFMAEAQNAPQPLEDAAQIPLTPDDILKRGINVEKNVCPAGSDFITAFIDVSRNVLWYTIMAWNKENFKGHVINYGIFPEQIGNYHTLASCKKTIPDRYPNVEYSQALTNALDECVNQMASINFYDEAGNPIYLERIGIDSGWGAESQTVYNYTRQARSKLLVSTKGFGSTPARRPLVDPEKERQPRTSLIGQWKFTRNNVGTTLLQYDTNLWKSKTNALLRCTNVAKTGITLFNKKVNGRHPNHRMFCDQISSETSIWVEGGGRRIETWKNPPHRDNHLLDCMVGCTVLAHVSGATMPFTQSSIQAVGGNTGKAIKKKRRKRYVQE